jgi:DNA repair protein RadC
LLAIVLGQGTTKIDVMTLAENLVRAVDAKGLNLKVEDLEHLEGMGTVKTMIVVAALEFARRRIKPGGLKITTPADILPLIRHFADRKQEHFLCITINGANEVLNVCVVSMGLSTAPQSTPARSSRTPSPTAPTASSWPTTYVLRHISFVMCSAGLCAVVGCWQQR